MKKTNLEHCKILSQLATDINNLLGLIKSTANCIDISMSSFLQLEKRSKADVPILIRFTWDKVRLFFGLRYLKTINLIKSKLGIFRPWSIFS